LVCGFALACVFALRCGEEFEDVGFKGIEGGVGFEEIEGGVGFEGIKGGICADIEERITGAIGVGIVGGIVGGIIGGIVGGIVGGVIGGGSTDRGVRVLAAQSIAGFSHSRYGIPRIIDCTSSEATKKVAW